MGMEVDVYNSPVCFLSLFPGELTAPPRRLVWWVGLRISEESSPSVTSLEVEMSSPVTEFFLGKYLWNEGHCQAGNYVPACWSFSWELQDTWLGCVTDGP